MDTSAAPHIDQRPEKGESGSSSVSWPHFGGMLMLLAGTVGFWALVFRHARGENRKRG